MAPIVAGPVIKIPGTLQLDGVYARYRIRHAEALAGRRHPPHVPSEGLRYMRVSYARVSKAAGSQ